MALKASPDDQALLLDLQQFDTRLQQLAHRAKSLPQLARITELTAAGDALRRRIADQTGAVEDTEAELKRVESDVTIVEARMARDSDRMQHTASVKDVQALEQELAALAKRRSDLEDIELQVMQRLEDLQAELAGTQSELDANTAVLAEATAERDAELGAIDSERSHAAANRITVAGKVPADLLALYEKQKERYGWGASHLRGGVSSASGVRLNESDMAVVRSAAPDDVVLCPDSNAILVRTNESGI
jgi:predicted  nucleic acid-binding Zn-ribbon protein